MYGRTRLQALFPGKPRPMRNNAISELYRKSERKVFCRDSSSLSFPYSVNQDMGNEACPCVWIKPQKRLSTAFTAYKVKVNGLNAGRKSLASRPLALTYMSSFIISDTRGSGSVFILRTYMSVRQTLRSHTLASSCQVLCSLY